jgi:uncharacterized Tic20 family protein
VTAALRKLGRPARWAAVVLLLVTPGTALLLPAVIWWFHRKSEPAVETPADPVATR